MSHATEKLFCGRSTGPKAATNWWMVFRYLALVQQKDMIILILLVYFGIR